MIVGGSDTKATLKTHYVSEGEKIRRTSNPNVGNSTVKRLNRLNSPKNPNV